MKFEYTIGRLQDGVPLTAGELEQVLLQEIEESGGTATEPIWNLAVLYSRTGRQREAIECVERLRALGLNEDQQLRCQLAMGQLQEGLGDFEVAARFYQEGLEMPSGAALTRYWLNNNLGYCLIQLGRPSEAMALLEAAIALDGRRANAHKNLGLAHAQLGAYAPAAQCFVNATQADALDPRSLKHLEELIAAHPEVLEDVPRLDATLAACREAVAFATAQQLDQRAHWERLRGTGKTH
jgi:tetratricopeptide (TPR) repeat protein